MSEIQMAHFSYGRSGESRGVPKVAREDDGAGASPRLVATDGAAARAGVRGRSPSRGLVSRVRLALAAGRGAPTDACGCAA